MFYQFFTAFTDTARGIFVHRTLSFGQTIMGAINTWPSYTQDILTANDTTVLFRPLTDVETSLLGSIPSLGAMVGTAVVGSIIGKFGRRKGGLLVTIPSILSWTMIELTTSPIVMLVARFLSGVTGGANLVYGPMFISETAQDSIRGMLASGPIVFYCLGALTSYLMGWFLNYHTIIWTNITMSVFAAVLCMLVVESPVFLMRQNKEEEARLVLAKYRNLSPSSKIVNEEISRLRVQLIPASELLVIKASDVIHEKDPKEAEKETLQEKEENIPEYTKKVSPIKALFTSRTSRRALFVICLTGTCQVPEVIATHNWSTSDCSFHPSYVFMGMVAIQVYAKKLFKQAAPDLSSNFCSVLLAIVLLAGGVVTAAIADKAGRRVLIICSSIMVGTCLVIMAVLMQTNLAPAWVTAVMVLVYSFSFFCGAGSVPYVLLAEVFAPEIQAVASMLFVELMWFLNFVLIAVYPPLLAFFGISGVFYVFGAVAFINSVISFFIVPETKGLNNQEIQEKFAKGKR